jgi:polar amino acid transport system ATP-binding protein
MKLEIVGLTQRFGATTVLDRLSLSTGDIQSLVLVGPSGGGKSTLLRILAGLDVPVAGSVAFDGVTFPRDEPSLRAYRRTVGTVFQAYNLFPHMTVLDNVTLGQRKVLGRSRQESEDRARRLLARFGLEEKAGEYPDRLSGGQQQRVAIVRAVAMSPEILLFDEITSALDPLLVGEVLDAVRELKEEGLTIVMATHEMGFAREAADRVCFLDGGVVLEEGTPEQVLVAPNEQRTREYLARFLG